MDIIYDFLPQGFYSFTRKSKRQLQSMLKVLTGKNARSPNDRINQLVNHQGSSLLLVYGNKIIIGMGTLIVTHQMAGIKARIEDVVVDEAYRGKGIGEEIVRRLIRRARKERAVSVELTSAAHRTAANALYRKLGFEQRETNVYRMELQKQKRTTTRRK